MHLLTLSKYQIILDDRQARAVAKSMGLFFIGTVGILVRAKQKGVVSAIKPLLEALESNGFYLSEGLRVEALHLVGE